MAEPMQRAGLLRWLDLSDDETDAERLAHARRALREAEGSPALALRGSFDGTVGDASDHAALIGLVAEARLPVLAQVSGQVGPRGLALLLCADRIVLGPDAGTAATWRTAPGLAAVLHHRFGPLPARAMLFQPSADPLAFLVASGVAVRSPSPSGEIDEAAARLGDHGRRFRRALKAAGELPLREALSFDSWFTRSQQGSAP